MPFSAVFIVSIAVILSAIVSVIGTGSRKQAVRDGRARSSDLCELTGILNPKALQDVFGPPTLNGLYNKVTLDEVYAARVPLGRLISEDRVDYLCIGIAALALFWSPGAVEVFLVAAAAYQSAGWFVSGGLPRKGERG